MSISLSSQQKMCVNKVHVNTCIVYVLYRKVLENTWVLRSYRQYQGQVVRSMKSTMISKMANPEFIYLSLRTKLAE